MYAIQTLVHIHIHTHIHNSAEAKDLIEKLLQKDPKKRITASNALVHEWFDKVMDGADTAANIHVNVQRMHHRLKRVSKQMLITQ
jgi:serine/threonine protein kinase